MTRFKARIWKSGTSNVLTIPAAIVGLDFKLGDEVEVQLKGMNAGQRIASPNFQDSLIHSIMPGFLA